LAQLAHNLGVRFKRWFLAGTKAGELGMERLVREVMAMPGQVKVRRRGSRKMIHLKLSALNVWAKAVAKGIKGRYPSGEWRAIWGKT
jgi:hypothetical protein